jgi:hypothetical protein
MHLLRLIRAALVLATVILTPESMGQSHEEVIPVSALLRDNGKNYLFKNPLYRASHIYLEPKRVLEYLRVVPKDGYLLEAIHVILRPAVYKISNWYYELKYQASSVCRFRFTTLSRLKVYVVC